MKNTNYIKYVKQLLFLFVILMYGCEEKTLNAYYFHPIDGNDTNLGTKESPFKTLNKVKEVNLKAGDSILLASNQVFRQSLELINVKGVKSKPIVVATYGENSLKQKAYIKTEGNLNGVLVKNSSFIEINNLKISVNPSTNQKQQAKQQMRCGVLIKINATGNYEHIYLNNLVVKDVFYENEQFTRSKKETKSANGTQNYGWGIRFINNTNNAFLSDVKVENCLVENVSHTGIKFTSRNSENEFGIVDFEVSNTKVLKTGGPGIQMSGVKNGHVFNNEVNYSGSIDDSRKWGRGSGLWTWGSENVLIEKNRFTNANGPGDSAGAHIDFNCKNIVLQYNFSANNAGGFCEILGNNYNCAYRYNISVNDGHRIKGKNDAFQEGKIFWLSGYVGKQKKGNGPFNSYFYNNTIFVKKEIETKIAINRTAKGILIANNIFHIEGNTKAVKGDQYRPEKKGANLVSNVFYKNNLFLYKSNWPKEILIKDEKPFFGNANFKNSGGLTTRDYIPQNIELIKNKGIKIKNLPKDDIGVFYGELTKDILGNTITNLPDLGAIKIN